MTRENGETNPARFIGRAWRLIAMRTVFYSTVFEQTADAVWNVIRDFNSYPVWIASVTESQIENDRSGDSVGAIRKFVECGPQIRQRLLAHSDLERSYTYESCEPLGAITYYQGKARVTPIVDRNRAFVEWSVSFDCPPDQQRSSADALERAMPQWMESLRSVLSRTS
jgi:uncharacterized membrane protein